MPLVTIDVRRLSASPASAPLDGRLTVTPVDKNGRFIRVTSGGVTVSSPIDMRISNGVPQGVIAPPPTDGTFCYLWEIVVDGKRLTRHTDMPATPPVVEFDALDDVNPATFEPTTEVIAAWTAVTAPVLEARDQTLAAAADVRGRTLTATVDPSDPHVLILTYPVFMLHPDGKSLLIPVEVAP